MTCLFDGLGLRFQYWYPFSIIFSFDCILTFIFGFRFGLLGSVIQKCFFDKFVQYLNFLVLHQIMINLRYIWHECHVFGVALNWLYIWTDIGHAGPFGWHLELIIIKLKLLLQLVCAVQENVGREITVFDICFLVLVLVEDVVWRLLENLIEWLTHQNALAEIIFFAILNVI